MAKTTTMLLTHVDRGLCRGEAEMTRTWRWNPCTDSREYGWKLLRYWGACDFGSREFMFQLPSGSDATADPKLVWEKSDAVYCYAPGHHEVAAA